ncbi:hypothetical protein ABFA07_022367 [Porites harrisoni]
MFVYDIQERRTNSRCKKDFILTIANVTDDDEGKYKCQWICDKDDPSYLNSTSFIQLNVFPFSTEPTTETTTGNTTSLAPPSDHDIGSKKQHFFITQTLVTSISQSQRIRDVK